MSSVSQKEVLLPFVEGYFPVSPISSLTQNFANEIYYPSKPNLKEWVLMLQKDPVCARCSNIKTLRAVLTFGTYRHKNPDYTKFINKMFDSIPGNLDGIVSKLAASTMNLGTSFAIPNFTAKAPGLYNKWVLQNVVMMDLAKITIKGKDGYPKIITYQNSSGRKVKINFDRVIHTLNSTPFPYESFLLWGTGDCEQAYNYYKLKQLALTEIALAAKNNGQGILWGTTTNTQKVQQVDENGMPIIDPRTGKPRVIDPQVSLLEKLKKLYSSDILVTSGDEIIRTLQVNTGERFWDYLFNFIEDQLMMAFGVPRQIYREGSANLADAGISRNHRAVLDSTIEFSVRSIRKEIISKIIKPILIWNFGEKEDFGEFVYNDEFDPNERTKNVNLVMSGIATGLFSADDPDIQEYLRSNLGLPSIPIDEIDNYEKQKEAQQAIKWFQNNAQILQTQSMAPVAPLDAPPTKPEKVISIAKLVNATKN